MFRSLLFLVFCSLIWSQSVHSTIPSTGYSSMISKYQQVEQSMRQNPYGVPVYIDSDFRDNYTAGEVAALVQHDFATVAAGLTSAQRWCDIVLLHINVKGCDAKQGKINSLKLYVGRRHYQMPEEAHEMQYQFRQISTTHDYFQLSLAAASGPLGTSDYVIKLEVIPFNEESSFILFKYSYQFGFTARLAMNSYLATVGRNKVGFSTVSGPNVKEPVYVRGLQGIVERNAMRYFLAIRSVLDTLNTQRWQSRVQRWVYLAKGFERQLQELNDDEYLKTKTKEFSLNINKNKQIGL